ncbi:MAG: tetratricopeptide repeat protein, partial [Polyangiales bacterium]
MITTAMNSDNNVDETLSMARRLVGEQEYNAAERVCREVLAQHPDHLGAINTLSHAVYAQGRPDAAVPLMERAVALAPDVVKYHSNLGFLRGVCGDDAGSVSAHERAVALAPAQASLRVNLANAYRLQRRYADARDMYKTALGLKPDSVVAWQNLADVQVGCDEHEDAIASLKQALTLEPDNQLARQQLVIVYRALERNDELAALYRAWIEEDPDGTPVARHMLAACTGEDVPARASDLCIERLFDQDASDFESHLVGALGYRAPNLCAEAFERHAPEPSKTWSIVDAGCGTGLCGPLFEPWARELEGVDLSGGMLEQAEAKEVYSRLHRAELTAFLEGASERWNAVVCADTFCYFGDMA